jgi:hypothetical protein
LKAKAIKFCIKILILILFQPKSSFLLSLIVTHFAVSLEHCPGLESSLPFYNFSNGGLKLLNDISYRIWKEKNKNEAYRWCIAKLHVQLYSSICKLPSNAAAAYYALN